MRNLGLMLLVGCGGPSLELMDRDALLDPENCQSCHPAHYEEWSGSMHAYAAEDPVFTAMNARGQRETNGELGDFCVDCHAPLAVQEGYTTDGLNLDEVPDHLKGVTCAFCHQVTDVQDDHNNPLVLAVDQVMRGALSNPIDPGVHEVAYSDLLDRDEMKSSEMCGSCHDIVAPSGVHLERTFLEWQQSLYSEETAGFGLSCSGCHMRGRDDVAAEVDGVPIRRVHSHTFAGVDVALTPFPQMEEQRAEVQKSLDTTVAATLCVGNPGGATVALITLENVAAGHAWPSGAAQDRRAWVEIRAYQGDAVVWSSGTLEPGRALVDLMDEDTNLWSFGDTMYDAAGEPTHFFWEAESLTTNLLLPPPYGSTPMDVVNHQTKTYLMPGVDADRVEMNVHIRPMGLDILDELIGSGDLDPYVRDVMPVFTMAGPSLTWTPDTGYENGDTTCVK